MKSRGNRPIMKIFSAAIGIVLATFFGLWPAAMAFSSQEPVWIAMNYPESGPCSAQGLDQRRAGEQAHRYVFRE